jgi:hypothetical protein
MNIGGRGKCGLSSSKRPKGNVSNEQSARTGTAEKRPRKREAMKRPKEEAGDQKRRTLSWFITFLISALLVVAGLGFLRSLIAIITLD